jgi:hypothetical protein
MTDEKKIRGIFRRRLGPTAPISMEFVNSIVSIINRSTPGLPPVVDLATFDDPATFERFRKALRELKTATSLVIKETTETLTFVSALEIDSFVARTQATLAHLKLLSAEVDLALSRCGPVRRRSDQRSRWHPTARAFAMFIESRYREAGMVAPSRSHVASPLVLAVQELLAELNITCTPDQVAKVLQNRKLRDRSEKNSTR